MVKRNYKLLLLLPAGIISYLNIEAEEPAESSTGSQSAEILSVRALPTDTVTDSIPGYYTTELDDFTVTAMRKLVQNDGAKLTYNVTEDPEAKSSNILDILRKVPGVTVDAEDNVRVNGQSSFKILKNGHDDPMLRSGDLKTILKSIPAASIKKIEVISEPGAKYEAEGAAGILNIITDTNTDLSGFMGQLSTWVNAYQVGGSLNAKAKLHNVLVSGNVYYNNGQVFKRKFYNTTDIIDLTGNDNHLNRNVQTSKSGWDYTGVDVNLSWEPDTLNLFTLAANFGNNGWGGSSEQRRTMYGKDYDKNDPASTIIWDMNRHYRDKGNYNGTSAQASFQHSFGRQDNNLIISCLFDYSHIRSNSASTIVKQQGPIDESPYSASHSLGDQNSHIVQIDYSDQFNKKHLLEAGAKVQLYLNRNNSAPWYGKTSEDALPEESERVNVSQFRDIYALYSSYTGTFDKWHVKGGLRYEHTRMGLKYRVGEFPDFTTKLHDLVPNAAVSYNFAPSASLRLAYQMRISRPGLNMLNPYVNSLTPGQLTYGNPNLKSQKAHNVSVSYSNYGGKLSGNVKATYGYTSNNFIDIIFMKDGIMHHTYDNVGKEHRAMIDVNLDWNITNSLRWSAYYSVIYKNIRANSELLNTRKQGWQHSVSTNINYTMPCKVRLSAYGSFWSPWFNLQTKGMSGYYYGLSASRSFLKEDALNISLGLSKVLPAYQHNKWTQTSETAKWVSRSRYQNWNVYCSVSFKLGGLKAEVKRTSANIEKESQTPTQSGESK